MTCPDLLARLDEAEARLSRISEAFDGYGIEFLWRNKSPSISPEALPPKDMLAQRSFAAKVCSRFLLASGLFAPGDGAEIWLETSIMGRGGERLIA